MQITVELPDDVMAHTDPAREALEAMAISGYRSGVLSEFQLAKMLGLARLEVDDFLADHGVYEHSYDLDDLERDRKSICAMKVEGLARS